MIKLRDALRAEGRVEIKIYRHGRLWGVRRVPNLVVNTGRTAFARRAAGLSEDPISHVAVGTGTTDPVGGDTTLETEVYRDSLTAVEQPSTGEVLFRLYVPSSSANGNTITEAGLFNASVGGDMYARTTFDGIDKTTSISFQVSWTINQAAN